MKGTTVSTPMLLGAAMALAAAPAALATVTYTPVSGGTPGLGPGVAPPSIVPGKEYSHDLDTDTFGAGGGLDPEQIIAWDGIGGAADGLDFTGTRPSFLPDSQIDATANHLDHLYTRILADEAHLVFSVDDMFVGYSFGTPFLGTLPSAGPVILGNGNVIGGAGELSVELGVMGVSVGNPFDSQSLWAPQPVINAMPLPVDVDGVELWGPEPGFSADTDKYSLDTDFLSFTPVGGPPGPIPGDAVSVWNGTGSPYIAHSMIVGAVVTLLGPDVPPDLINLDALMVQDTVGSPDEFEIDPAGGLGADSIIFSIEQIPDPTDLDGYYATGSELFVLDATGAVMFLTHGGHVWDHAYSLAAFSIFPGMGPNDPNYAVIDINAIEAISEGVIPEPSSLALVLVGAGLVGARRRRA